MPPSSSVGTVSKTGAAKSPFFPIETTSDQQKTRTPIPALPQTQKRQRSPDTSSSNSPKTPDTPEPEEGGFLARRSRRGSLPKVQPQPQVVRLRICEECKFAAESDSRYEAHLKEPRHVNYYRNLAYMQPKKRQMWLKVWFTELEDAEKVNWDCFELEEENEEECDQDQEEENQEWEWYDSS